MAEAMTALEMHFVLKVNVVACRHAFRQRLQKADESVTQYIAVLHDLAVPCAFGEMKDEMIRDQLIEHAHQCQIRDRLLLEDDLTLQRAVTLACQVESKRIHSQWGCCCSSCSCNS